MLHWLFEDIVKFEVDEWFVGNLQKNVTVDVRKMDVLPHGAVVRCQGCQVILGAHCQT